MNSPVPDCRVVNEATLLNSLGECIPGLWIGNLQSSKEIAKLPSSKWTIVSVLGSDKLMKYAENLIQELRSKQKELDIEHIKWQLEDKVNAPFLLSGKLQEVLAGIDRVLLVQDGNAAKNHPSHCVLVHCVMGSSRSVAVCAAWLLSRYQDNNNNHNNNNHDKHMNVEQALNMIRKARPRHAIHPNLGFIACLKAIEHCDGNIEAATKRMCVVNGVSR